MSRAVQRYHTNSYKDCLAGKWRVQPERYLQKQYNRFVVWVTYISSCKKFCSVFYQFIIHPLSGRRKTIFGLFVSDQLDKRVLFRFTSYLAVWHETLTLQRFGENSLTTHLYRLRHQHRQGDDLAKWRKTRANQRFRFRSALNTVCGLISLAIGVRQQNQIAGEPFLSNSLLTKR